MKLAVFSDIHGNLEALESIYNDIKKQNVDEIIYLGDAIGLGPQFKECLEFIMNHPDIKMVLGNHEERQKIYTEDYFKLDGHVHHQWIHNRLNKEHLDFINNLPIYIEREYNGKKIFFSHFFLKSMKPGNLYYPVEIMDDKNELIRIINNLNYDYYFIGHNHINYEYPDLHILDVGTSGCVYDNKTSYYIVNVLDEITYEKIIIEFDREKFNKSFEGFINVFDIPYRFFGIKM